MRYHSDGFVTLAINDPDIGFRYGLLDGNGALVEDHEDWRDAGDSRLGFAGLRKGQSYMIVVGGNRSGIQ